MLKFVRWLLCGASGKCKAVQVITVSSAAVLNLQHHWLQKCSGWLNIVDTAHKYSVVREDKAARVARCKYNFALLILSNCSTWNMHTKPTLFPQDSLRLNTSSHCNCTATGEVHSWKASRDGLQHGTTGLLITMYLSVEVNMLYTYMNSQKKMMSPDCTFLTACDQEGYSLQLSFDNVLL